MTFRFWEILDRDTETPMELAKYVHENGWGGIIDHPGPGVLEIRWYDATVEMTADDFNEFLSTFATHVERCGRTLALVDALAFRMPMERMSVGWRDEHIVPRYNAAKVQRFAFVMPAGMPAIGKAPAPEGPASFPTAYFGRRADALAWLGG